MTFARPLTCIIFLILFLVGCTSVPPKDSGCIKTSVISTLSRVPLYTAMEEDSRIATLAVEKIGCDVALLEGKADVKMNLKITIPAARKDKGNNKIVTFPVFVALLNREDTVIDRHDEMIQVPVKKIALSHTHTINYHLPEGSSPHTEDYRILVGFNGSARAARADVKYSNENKKVIHKRVSKKKNKRKK